MWALLIFWSKFPSCQIDNEAGLDHDKKKNVIQRISLSVNYYYKDIEWVTQHRDIKFCSNAAYCPYFKFWCSWEATKKFPVPLGWNFQLKVAYKRVGCLHQSLLVWWSLPWIHLCCFTQVFFPEHYFQPWVMIWWGPLPHKAQSHVSALCP